MIIHVVKPGESLYYISKKYDISPNKIAKDNELTNPNDLVVGQSLIILKDNRTHTVKRGDSIYTIANQYGVSVNDILKANPSIQRPYVIYEGQNITIPLSQEKLGNIDVNGYAFPSTNENVLKRTLPNLTYLSIFSYDVNRDGTLNTIDDTPLIKLALDNKVAPIMVITNIEKGGGFSSSIANSILSNENIQNTLLQNVTKTMKEKGYYGLNIDFEYIYPQDREKYNNFLSKAYKLLKGLGYTVITSLAPKTERNQKGLLYEAHDYGFHGKNTDRVVLMTYEWGYTYGPPLAVAPLNQVKKVLDYAVTEIPSKKILMGIPNYGYNWTLPYIKGTSAETLSNVGAVDLARRVKTLIQYDMVSKAPFYYYYDRSGKAHVVWFEDPRSIYAKLLLVNEYNLGGVSYWTIGTYFPQNWVVLNSLYNVNKVL